MDPSRRNLGQQDCKDFFICLVENRNHWLDVYKLFKVKSVSSTKCTSCNNVSSQIEGSSESIFFQYECPPENVQMSTFIEQKLNGSEEVTCWRDERGCKQLTVGRSSTRLQDVKATDYLLFSLSRLIRVEGNLQIVDRKVKVGGNMTISDNTGCSAVFSSIAIIYHTGQVTGNMTSGHYQADVLDVASHKRIRTSEDNHPMEISEARLNDH